eukprot:TRINITY_DN8810_c0_g2_i1.p1 TRINITY_DN8810_c0_g2~~TRINITY_DN8810_c0_g2_i1.p1  ORF type:complete len:266 (+),score=62.71 TRINITY_DN8810_c0_g2_i1:83-880(+)
MALAAAFVRRAMAMPPATRTTLSRRTVAPFNRFVRHGTTSVAVEVPTRDEDFVSLDTRVLSNKHFMAYKGNKRLRQSAEFWKVFPDVLPRFPTNVNLVVSYGPTRHETVYRGNYLEMHQVDTAPSVTFSTDTIPKGANSHSSHWTLAMVDPDAQPGQGQAQLHWLIVNIPENDVGAGNAVVEYSAGYPKNGLHRYVFALFRQDQPLMLDGAALSDTPFHMESFAAQHGLEPLGLSFYQAGVEQDEDENEQDETGISSTAYRYAGL